MDMVTDAKIKEVVDTDLADRTIVAVAHRICKCPSNRALDPHSKLIEYTSATIIDFDVILVLDEGKVAEFGPPKELLRDRNSRFSRLAAAQGLDTPRDRNSARDMEESDVGEAKP